MTRAVVYITREQQGGGKGDINCMHINTVAIKRMWKNSNSTNFYRCFQNIPMVLQWYNLLVLEFLHTIWAPDKPQP